MNKKSLLVALTATAVLFGCSKNEVVDAPKPGVISFNPSTKNALRAKPINATNLTTDAPNFKVWGYLTNGGNQYVGTSNNGIHITYKNSKWDYNNPADIAYWPGGAIDFYAINPETNANLTDYAFSATSQKFKYTAPTANAQQADVMYAIAKDVTKPSNSTVELKFKHALSQIVFKGQSVSNTLEVEVKSITIHNVKNAGTYTLPTATTNVGTSTGQWTLENTYDNYSAGLVANAQVQSNMQAVDLSDNTTGAILLLPQTTTKWTTTAANNVATSHADTNKHTYLKLELKIKQNGTYIHGDANTFAVSYVPFGESWEEGKKYIYTLKFGGGFDEQGRPILQPIQYTATVVDWDVQQDKDISLVTN